MKKILFVALSLIWLLGVSSHVKNQAVDYKKDLEYTVVNDVTYRGTDLYVTENTDECGLVYQIGESGMVKNLFRTDSVAKETVAEQIAYSQGSVYLVVSAVAENETGPVSVYNVLRLDPDTLEATGCQHWMKPFVPGLFSDMSVDGDYVYLTQLIEKEKRACVYALSLDSFKNIDEFEDLNIRNVITVRYSDYVDASEDYRFVYAKYDRGDMITIENGNGLLYEGCYDKNAQKRYDEKKVTLSQAIKMNKSLVIRGLWAFLAGELLLFALFVFFYRRNRVGYMIFIWEIMLGIVFCMGLGILGAIVHTQDIQQGVRFAEYALSDLNNNVQAYVDNYSDTDEFYSSADYRNMVVKLEDLQASYNEGKTFLNLLLADVNTGKIIAAANGYDRCSLEKVYGSEVDAAAVMAAKYGATESCEIYRDGDDAYIVCMGPNEEHPSVVLVSIFDEDQISVLQDTYVWLVVLMAILFAFASIAGIVNLLIQSRDLHKMGSSMEAIANEKRVKKPGTLGADMGDMWSGLLDIDRSIKNVNYRKYKLYEAYYRFAPKSVEMLLGKDSVTEVESGESVTARGTVASYSMDIRQLFLNDDGGKSEIRREISDGNIKRILDFVNSYQREGRVLQVSADSDMTEMKFIMPEDNREAISFGIEFHKMLQKGGFVNEAKQATIFMLYSDFVYGVAGTDEHAMQVMIAPGFIMLEDYLHVLTELRLRLVVTDEVFDREHDKHSHRLIGYFQLAEDELLPLYEILEACPDAERHLKEETDASFQEALKMFKEQDFYLSRNLFAHILKKNPQDTVARWYVFACEKYLESGTLQMSVGLNQEVNF